MSTTASFPITRLAATIRSGNRLVWISLLAYSLGAIICAGLMLVDQRLFNGVNVWDKPAKFFFSLAVQFATVNFALGQMPEAARRITGLRRAMLAMVIAATLELFWIALQAARGQASHYNDSSVFYQIAYGVMGVGALTLVGTGFYAGWRLWLSRGTSLMAEATATGLMLGMVAGGLAAIYLSSQHGHWVGGELSDAHGLGFFSWSSTGGDLRVPHFIGLHLAQALPLAALSGSRRFVYLVAALGLALTAITFAMAVMGIPLLRA